MRNINEELQLPLKLNNLSIGKEKEIKEKQFLSETLGYHTTGLLLTVGVDESSKP